jgi:NAD(P)H-quinone oxidoreductase subunit 5
MTTDPTAFVALASPAAFALVSLFAITQPGPRPRLLERLSVASAGFAIAVAAVAAWLVAHQGPMQSPTLGFAGIGFAIRLDPLSAVIFSMIALLAFNIVRFSRIYMDGDSRQGVFLGWLCATIASVQLLVLSGNLGQLVLTWILTSFSLHQLLVFYRDRRRGLVAAHKKFVAARVGDICLIGGAALLYMHFGTGSFDELFTALRSRPEGAALPPAVQGAALLIAVAALLKSAQFPTHSWVVEVMETPTPVSALLHAGILNAGPFLMVRMSAVLDGATFAPTVLVLFGGFTALFASNSLLTQPSIKGGLGYSSASHMGFMLMICGLGVYSAAILHLVAHSFYKAHAFLSSGSVIDTARAANVKLPKRLGNPLRVALSIVAAAGIFAGFSQVLELAEGTLPVGIILIMGIAQIIAPALDSDGNLAAIGRTLILGVSVALAFFVLEHSFAHVLRSELPLVLRPTAPVVIAIWSVVTVFGIATLFQIFRPAYTPAPWQRRLSLHLRNGLYANAGFDRLIGALRQNQAQT